MSLNSKNSLEKPSLTLGWEQREVLSDSKNLTQDISSSLSDWTFHQKFRINDNHMHTDFTDWILSPYRLIDVATMQWLTNITITDHNTTKPARMAKKYAQNKNLKIQVNVWIELSTDKWHIILANLPDDLNLDFPQPGKMTIDEYKNKYPQYQSWKEIYPGMSLDALLNIVQNKYPQVSVIFPHPFDGMDTTIQKLKSRSATNFGWIVPNAGWIGPSKAFFRNWAFIEGFNQTAEYNEKLIWFTGYKPWSNMTQYAESSKDNVFIAGTDTHIWVFNLVNIVKKWDGEQTVFDQMKNWNFVVIKKLPSKKSLLETMKAKIDSTHSNDVKFYSSRLFDYFINEQKLYDKDFAHHTKTDEIRDTIWKYVRIFMYSKIYKNRIKDILQRKGSEFGTNEVLARLKNREKVKAEREKKEWLSKWSSTRFWKELIPPIQ